MYFAFLKSLNSASRPYHPLPPTAFQSGLNIISERVLTPKLRRENRIKTIRSSLYIEANTLTLEQLADVIDGKKVIGPKRDIEEVKGAKAAYDHLLECDPLSVRDLLKEYKYMMRPVMSDAGHFC